MKPIDVNSPETKSTDLAGSNVEALRALFPEAFTEGRIDFEVLKQLLGGVVDEREEKFGLNWHGKRQARQLALTPSTGTLRPAPEDSVDWNATQNLMIEGDNLEVLKLLQKSYAGKVKMIYIDPPYNTGKDFVYNDDFKDSIGNYLRQTGQVEVNGGKTSTNSETSGRFHTDWLNMMYPRLMLAKNLLRHDGIIFISIDEGEVSNLLAICDDIFGEENDLGTIVWKGATDNNPTQVAVEHEYILCFARMAEVQTAWKDEADEGKRILLDAYKELKAKSDPLSIEELQLNVREFIKNNKAALAAVTHYDRVDDGGIYTGSRKVHNPKPGGYVYDVIHPTTNEACVPPVNGYRFPKDKMTELLEQGRVLFGEDDDQIIQLKQYLHEYEGKLSSVIHLDSRTGANELNKLFGVQKVFSNPKPEALLTRLFGFVVENNDIVLDFFAGSGSSAQAVRRLNIQDGGNRRFILVQLPEELDPKDVNQKVGVAVLDKIHKPRNIAELTKERLRRAGTQLKAQNPLFFGEFGFRVFKLDSTNIRPWESNRDKLTETLDESVEHIKAGRTEQDVLYEVLLKLGLELTVPMETRFIAAKMVYSVGAGTLLVCLAEAIAATEIESLALGIVEWHHALAPAVETTVVFRDSAFADDVAKTNLTAILTQHGLENVRSL